MSIKEKIVNSKAVRSVATSKTFNKALTAVGAASTAITSLMISASAEDTASNIGTVLAAEVNSGDIIKNAQPFITAGLPIICVVGGIKLGVRFLRSSIH